MLLFTKHVTGEMFIVLAVLWSKWCMYAGNLSLYKLYIIGVTRHNITVYSDIWYKLHSIERTGYLSNLLNFIGKKYYKNEVNKSKIYFVSCLIFNKNKYLLQNTVLILIVML